MEFPFSYPVEQGDALYLFDTDGRVLAEIRGHEGRVDVTFSGGGATKKVMLTQRGKGSRQLAPSQPQHRR